VPLGAGASLRSKDVTRTLTAADLKTVLIHLRFHFQLLLAPVFLWGWLLAGGGLSAPVLLGFVAFHLFLYPGATAFNSAYDRDTGPVGGLEKPPPVNQLLLPTSLALKAAGWLLAAFVNLPFWLAYGAFVVLSIAYSHPRVRFKARTLTSLAVVGFGQGALAFLAAWAATRGELTSAWGIEGALGATAAVLLILALYPLTQLYQVDEDAARGDRTLAVAWGASRSFAFARVCTSLGGLVMLAVLARRFGLADALLVGIGLAIQLAAIDWLARGFNPRAVLATYRRVMGINAFSASALGVYLLVRLASGGG
jgi:1,4-dihydroxy-2-naphthoate octaprenyltransferase